MAVATMPTDWSQPAAPAGRWRLFLLIVCLFPVIDLAQTWLYALTGSDDVIALRYARDASCFALALHGFTKPGLPLIWRLSVGGYGLLILLHVLIGLLNGAVPLPVIINSAAALILPMALTLAAFDAVDAPLRLGRMIQALTVLALSSVIFGVWETQHTEFWVLTARLGEFVRDVKNVPTGFQPDVLLPWNFVNADGSRRTAGLLAAPLANGFFLAVVGLAAFAYWRQRSLWLAVAILAACTISTEATATRSAMLTLAIGGGLFLLLPAAQPQHSWPNRALLAVGIAAVAPLFLQHFLFTLSREDSSGLGHLDALEANLRALSDTVLGHGLGAAGGYAANLGLDIEGGGEGALFSLLFQLGWPGVMLFTIFLFSLARRLAAACAQPHSGGEIARAALCLLPGVLLTLPASEHIFTFSGMAAFWFLCGAIVAVTPRKVAA